jgi:hypothetical protein
MASGTSYDSSRRGSLTTTDPLEFALARRDARVAEGEAAEWQARFDSGRSIAVETTAPGDDHITVRGTSGAVELEVTLTDKGPVLHFRAAEIQLQASGRLSVDCEELDVRAPGGITQQTDGDLLQVVRGDASIAVKGDLSIAAAETEIRSARGDVRVKANDDVLINGERVKLNC